MLKVHDKDIIDSSRVISNISLRRLFEKFCNEVSSFSEGIGLRANAFELVFSDDENLFEMTVTPYRDLFKVSFGGRRSHEIRVSSLDDFFIALDTALHYFLSSKESRN
ncbi:MAG: hypothetical protein B6D63_04025 [Candidatus Latescibacteria bacterium 4484_7]|nr:MAG: hypothetical protein B6D63_04025 [Candidatus Latescibacteria bacterium 4484_7]